MATEQHAQHQHAQWLASLASGHFVQQAIESASQEGVNQPDDSQSVDDDSHVVDMSGQTVVKLVPEPDTPTSVHNTSPFNLRKKRKVDRDETSRHDDYKLIPSKDRAGSKNFDMRRPVRPIDRQKMRPWLKNLLDVGSVFGLNWLTKEDGIFQISWRHASRLGWNLETDGDVFERWARHTGIFKDGDEPEPKRWKANFRCALHSLPDVKELTSPTDRKGRNASRTYRFLRPNEVQPPVKRKQRYNIQIPYNVYEPQASEDSGSQHGESDDRNTDEEIFPEQARLFPHCDHDYAVRADRSDEEHRTTEVLPRHNSGYVLIKSKDAHEFEFRLTQPEGTAQPPTTKRPTPAPKSTSPQKKTKGGKKRTLSGNSPVKKGKGKVGPKGAALKKEGRQAKKVKKPAEKEPSPSTKVSLKALLSGRKNSAKRAKGGQGVSQASKKAKGGKKVGGAAVKGRGKKEGGGSGAGTPNQAQGLQALLEAASQIDRMDALTSPSVTVPTNTKAASSARSKRLAARTSVTAVVPPKAAPIIHTTTQAATLAAVPSIATPIVFATDQMVPVTGATFTPHPVLTSGPSTAASVPAQVSLSILQKYLGLSALPATAVSTVPLQVLPSTSSDSSAEAQALPVTGSSQISKTGEAVTTSKTVANAVTTPSPHLLMAQPEAGTSMLKHLLRLTGPAVTTSAAPPSIPTPAVNIIPAAPQVLTPLVTSASSAGAMLKETNVTKEPLVKVEPGNAAAAEKDEEGAVDQAALNNYQIVAEYELGSSQEGSWLEANKHFPYVRVSKSKVYIKPESVEGEEMTESVSGRHLPEEMTESVSGRHLPQSSVDTPASHSTALLQSGDGTSAGLLDPQAPVTPAAALSPPSSVTPSTVGTSQMLVQRASSSVPQVTLCLPQLVGLPQAQQASGSVAQTMTVTLPQASAPASQGQAVPTTTFTQSMDLMQFLNLCAASGNNQVIIKTETPIPTDIAAMSSAYSSDNAAIPSQTEEGASAAPKFILVDTSLQAPAAVTAVPGGGQLQTPGGQIIVSLANPALSATVNNAAVSATVASPTLASSVDPTSLPASEQAPPVLMQTPQEVMPSEVSSASGVEVVTNQFIMNEADISSLSEDQHGADSFVVASML